MDGMGLDETDFWPCELCGAPGVDCHHLVNRSRGGKDEILNLLCLCRSCHIEYGDKKQHMEMLKEVHERNIP